ncbi:MAG: PAS domain S-box protein [Acidobacteria bacterium]|nr:PAS domain S-box protein [Acidobacteriota bacterium]
MSDLISHSLKGQSQHLHPGKVDGDLFGLLFEKNPDGMLVLDQAGRVSLMNPAAEQLLGKTASELVGLPLGIPIVSDERIETEVIRPDSSPVIVEIQTVEIQWDESPALLATLRDITKHKQVERTLRATIHQQQSLAHLTTSILDALPVHLAILDEQGVIQTVNESWQAFGRMNGLHEPFGIGESYLERCDCVTDEDRDSALAVQSAIEMALAGQQVHDPIEYPCHSPTEQRWFQALVAPLPATPFAGVVVMHINITERKLAELSLKESERRFQEFMDYNPAATWITDQAGAIQYANQRFTQMFQLRNGNPVGQLIQDLFPPVQAEHHLAIMKQVCATERAIEVTESLTCPDGATGFFLIYRFPIRSEFQLLVGGVAIDITTLKKAEVALKESETRYRTLVDASAQVVVSINIKGHLVGNQSAWAALTGQPIADLADKGWIYGFHPDHRPIISQLLETTIQTRTSAQGEFLIQTGGNGYRLFSLRSVPNVDDDGSITELVTAFTDITELKEAEEKFRQKELQFLQAQKMEAIGRLASGVAHDFNNLLTVIGGYTELALRRTHPQDPIYRFFVEVQKASESAGSLTRQLLAFSRKQVLQSKILDLNKVIANLEKMLRRLIGEDIFLEVTLSTDLRPVQADPGQLEQVLLNLAVNARDAMPKGGKLELKTQNATAEKEGVFEFSVPPGEFVSITMTDTGTGIAPDVLSQIFEPFYTTKEDGKGTGLGLSTVYGIVRQSDGHIFVTSEVGKGSRFWIFLPAAAFDIASTRATTISAGQSSRSETVLVVEDADNIRRLTVEILQLSGFTVLEAENGPRALEIIKRSKQPINLLLTDVVLPTMSGTDLAQLLRREYPEMKILFMSGYLDVTQYVDAQRELKSGFIQKPFTPEGLLKAIEKVMGE